jgi:hypothetical protein
MPRRPWARDTTAVLRLGAVSLVACSVACRPSGTHAGSDAEHPAASVAVDAAAGTNESARTTSDVRVSGESFAIERWSFGLDTVDLSIQDLQMTGDLAGALRAANGAMAVNGGFFGEGGKPVGLVVSRGEVLSPFAPRLSGGVFLVDGGRASIADGESFDAGAGATFAVQCRPRLVVHGAAHVARDDGQRAERTALCLRDGGRALDIVIARSHEGGPSLFALGHYLASAGCDDALNLDGGPSTGVAWRDGDDVRLEPPRGPLRHAIVVTRHAR